MVAALAAGCGARTGLRVPSVSQDASVFIDVPVFADVPDAACPGDGLVAPRVLALASAHAALAVAPEWSTPRAANTADGAGWTLAAPADGVAALVAATAALSLVDLAAFAEDAVVAATGAVPVLVGRHGSVAGGWTLQRSVFRVAQPGTAAALRDRVGAALHLASGPADAGFATASAFTVEVTTALRADRPADAGVVLVAVAPETLFADAAAATAVRVDDLLNGTGLGDADGSLEASCAAVDATRPGTADFLWLVDTSYSMGPHQERLGTVAQRFFDDLRAAGVDFRVGVMNAGSVPPGPDLDAPGFAWIDGASVGGAQRLAWTVTEDPFGGDPLDTLQPYPLAGMREEPLAAGVLTTEAMARRAPDPTHARDFRPGAVRVAFFVSDEAGTNDDVRYFARDLVRWGASRDDRVRAVTAWYRNQGFRTYALATIFRNQPCPSTTNFVPCLVSANGGATIPIGTATEAEITAALHQIAGAVAGAASEFAVPFAPVSSTLRVRVDGAPVPRSHADGFDYDDGARALSFYGSAHRPRPGQTVRMAAFRWR